MLGNIGLPTLLFIILIALLLFGPNKLPELGRALGKTLREFKKGAKEVMEDVDEDGRPRKDTPKTEVMSADGGAKEDRRLPE